MVWSDRRVKGSKFPKSHLFIPLVALLRSGAVAEPDPYGTRPGRDRSKGSEDKCSVLWSRGRFPGDRCQSEAIYTGPTVGVWREAGQAVPER